MKERLKTLGDYKQDLQKEVNTIIRLIDSGCKCISCGTLFGQMQAGHYRAVGGWENLRFNLNNIFLQCSRCNDPKRKGGNVIKYREGLIETFGQDTMNYIDGLNIEHPFVKPSKIELQERIQIARRLIRVLTDLNTISELPRNAEVREFLRKTYNTELNIYN
jgi:hypothetical protein